MGLHQRTVNFSCVLICEGEDRDQDERVPRMRRPMNEEFRGRFRDRLKEFSFYTVKCSNGRSRSVTSENSRLGGTNND